MGEPTLEDVFITQRNRVRAHLRDMDTRLQDRLRRHHENAPLVLDIHGTSGGLSGKYTDITRSLSAPQ